MNLLTIRQLVSNHLQGNEDVKSIDAVNPLSGPGPWALDITVDDGTGTGATRAFQITFAEKLEDAAPSPAGFVAQYRVKGGEWVTAKTGGQDWETAWDGLADEMQRRGLRYGELGGEHGFIRDVINGEPVTAEDGTEFRLLTPKVAQ
jgi:hypothetical protein